MKIKITLRNGMTVDADDCSVNDVGALAAELHKQDSTPVTSTPEIRYVLPQQTPALLQSKIKDAKTRGPHWSEKDILIVCRTLLEGGIKDGEHKRRCCYAIQTIGDQRFRNSNGIYMMCARLIKYIFLGDSKGMGMSKSVLHLLKKNGIICGQGKGHEEGTGPDLRYSKIVGEKPVEDKYLPPVSQSVGPEEA